MTSTFIVGDTVPSAAEEIPLGEGRATAIPYGLQIVVRIENLDAATSGLVEHGLVALGVRVVPPDVADILLAVGGPGEPGHFETKAAADSLEDMDYEQLGTEIVLCDQAGVVRAVRRFEGLFALPDAAGN